MNPYTDLGGSGPLLHLAPANGFPPECYQPLAAELADLAHTFGYRPRPLHPGHDPAAMRSWHDLSGDLLRDAQDLAQQPQVAVGHSLGGVLSLYAALRRPGLFRGLILIDPVILPWRMLPLIWLAKRSGQIYRHPLVSGAVRRRDRFASRDEARTRFQGRGVFANMDERALDAYVEHGLLPDGAGFTLAWPKTWESAIFAAQPIDVWNALAKLRLPLLIIRGIQSDLLIDDTWRMLRRRFPQFDMAELSGGHMLPLERPAETAALMRAWLQAHPN